MKNYNTIVLNSNMVNMLMDFKKEEYLTVTSSFPPCVYNKMVSNPYVHSLIFTSKEDRDKAYNALVKYKKETGLEYQFYYRGEDITTKMLDDIKDAHGDFGIWESIEDGQYPIT